MADVANIKINGTTYNVKDAVARNAIGGPNVAATKAAMTDKSKVYVYTGSESGMTRGNWYYWNGSAWTSGGVYQSTGFSTDTTLTVSGMPADAKSTGDEIDKINAMLRENSDVFLFRELQTLNKALHGISHLVIDDGTNNKKITTTSIMYAEDEIILNSKSSNMRYLVAYYSDYNLTTSNYLSASSWQTGEYKIPKGSYFIVQMDATNGTTFSDSSKYDLDIAFASKTLWHIIVTGQSLAVGAEGNPALTVTTPYNYIGKAYQFNGGSRVIDGMENDTGVEEIGVLDNCLMEFSSLCEGTHTLVIGQGDDQRYAYQGETISSALGYWFADLTGKRVLVSDHGFGGKTYSNLKKGSIAYQNSIRAVYHAKEICKRYGWTYKVYAIAVVHGEADLSGGVSAETYKQYLKEWQNDYDADIKAITGQIETVQLFSSQTAAASSYNLSESPVPNGVFLASIEDDDIHLVAPQYASPLTYASIHMDNNGYRTLGEFFGQAIARRFLNYADLTLYPIASYVSGTTITISFNRGGGDLTYDGNNVSAVSDGNWGFNLVGDTNNAEITNVQIRNNTIQISLNKVPSSNAKISYAYKVLDDEKGKIGYSQGVRGNLRCTTNFRSMFRLETVANWCCVFCIPINWSAN